MDQEFFNIIREDGLGRRIFIPLNTLPINIPQRVINCRLMNTDYGQTVYVDLENSKYTALPQRIGNLMTDERVKDLNKKRLELVYLGTIAERNNMVTFDLREVNNDNDYISPSSV